MYSSLQPQADSGTGIDQVAIPPLNFKEAVATLIMLGTATLACLGIALALMIQLYGSSVARLEPGPAFQVANGELRLGLIPAGSIYGHPGESADDQTPVPIGPFPPGSVWTVGEHGTVALPPGPEGSRLTLVDGKPEWRISAGQEPFLYNRAFINANRTRGTLFSQKVLNDDANSFQIRAVAQNLDKDAARPVWFIEFTISLSIINHATPGTGVLAMEMVPILPIGYQLAKNAKYATSATAIMAENVTTAISVYASGYFEPADGILLWSVNGLTTIMTSTRYLSGRITFAVELESDA
jgi:hypothetical protein